MATNKYTTNNNHTLVAASNSDGETPVYLYADPVTHALIVSSSGGGGGAVTIADGADVTQGSITDVAVAAGGAGTISAKMRRLTTDVGSIDIKIDSLATETTLGQVSTTLSSIEADTSSMDGQLVDVVTNLVTLASTVTNSGMSASSSLQVNGVDGGGDQRVISTNTSGHVNIADGGSSITVDGTVSLDALTNSATGTITASAQTVSISVVDYASAVFMMSGTYGTVNIAFEASIDGGTTWMAVLAMRTESNTVEISSGSLTNNTRAWRLSVANYTDFRVRSTAWGSGTANIRISTSNFSNEVVPGIATHAVTQSGTWSVGANSAIGAATPANAFYMGMSDGTNLVQLIAVTGDGLGSAVVRTNALTYNGTNFDRARSVTNSTNSTGTGIAAVGLVAQLDDTSPTTITENQFGNVRMSTDRSLLTTTQNSYAHISTSTTTTVKSGAGTLKAVIVNTLGTVASTTTIYDNTAGSGTVIGVINTLALGGTFTFDIQFSTGLTLVTTGTAAPDITVSYK